MTNEEKRKIDTLRNEGCGCTAIAAALGLSLNSVKSYCRRTKPQAPKPVTIEIKEGCCEYCGAELVHIEGKKKKRFCSDKCRMTWWNHHRDRLQDRVFADGVFVLYRIGRVLQGGYVCRFFPHFGKNSEWSPIYFAVLCV